MSDVYRKYQPPGGGSGLFLKLEDGKSAKVRIASEPYIFNSEFQGNVSTKYAWVVFNRDENRAQILQLPVTGYRSIAAIAADDDWGDPTTFDVKVYREGSGLDTKYHVTPSPNRDSLTDEEKSDVATIELTQVIKNAIPLQEAAAGKQPPPPSTADRSQPKKDVVIEDLPDDPVPLEDIPF